MEEAKKRKLIRVACHGAALTSWSLVTLGVPIAALIMSEDPYVKDSASESLNFAVNLIVWGLVAAGLWFTIIGIPLALLIGGIAGLAALILPIVAMVSVCADPERQYRYPFIFRFAPSRKIIEG